MNARTATGTYGAGSLQTCGVLLLVLAVACTRESPPPTSDEGNAPPSAEPSRPDTGPPTAPVGRAPTGGERPTPPVDSQAPAPGGWAVGVVEAEPALEAAWPIPIVSALRTGTNEGFDRLTIELGEGQGVPGYHIEYIDRPLIQCGSGNQIFPVGDAWLEIRLEPAQAHTDEGRPTLPGREIGAEQRLMRRIYVTCDFEGVVTLVVAVETPNAFSVSTLTEPRRIVVDVRH